MEAAEFPGTSARDFLSVIFKRQYQIPLFFAVTVATLGVATVLAKPT